MLTLQIVERFTCIKTLMQPKKLNALTQFLEVESKLMLDTFREGFFQFKQIKLFIILILPKSRHPAGIFSVKYQLLMTERFWFHCNDWGDSRGTRVGSQLAGRYWQAQSVGVLGATTGLNKAFRVTPDNVMAQRVTTTVGGAASGGVFAAGNYAISEERSEVNWRGTGIEFFKGAASSALTSDPLKSVSFERPLQTMAGDTSAGQRVAVAGVSGVAVSVNGVAVEEISDDKQ